MKLRPALVPAAALGAVALALPASAAVTFDAGSGEGFVGKGDVQTAFDWNNRDLQKNADRVDFSVSSVTETTWECVNTRNDKVQERSSTTTISGLLKVVTRERNQITGFTIEGYDGSSSKETDGPRLESCPGDSGNSNGNGGDPWTLVPDSTETTTSGDATAVTATVGGVSKQL